MTRLIPALTALMLSGAPAMADRVAVLVFDASGSMWNRVEGDLTRIEVARDVMGDYFTSRDTAVPLSVIAYGHNRRGDCADIEVIAQMGEVAGSLESRLRALMPRGMTPLTDSLAMARDQIPPAAEAADIILVTDGLENCEGDPCALAAGLAAEGIDIRAHVVGFGLTEVEVESLSCITDQTGGMLFQTNSGAELAEALQQVSAATPPPLTPEPEQEATALLAQNFVFQDTGSGRPVEAMIWRAEGADGTVLDLGVTEGRQQNLQGLSTELPLGDWLIIAEGAEGRAERQVSLSKCCGYIQVPFTGTEMVAAIPPLGQVQAGMRGRLPYQITHPGTGNLGGTPYTIIATGPEGVLTRDQVLSDDLITSRDPGQRAAAFNALPPGTYRLAVAVLRNSNYVIIDEQSFEVVENPVVSIVGPDHALPGERIALALDGGYAVNYAFGVSDADGRKIGNEAALYQGAGGNLSVTLAMPDREGVYDLVLRRSGHPDDRDTIITRRPITIGATVAATQGADTLPGVPATFRLPPEVPQSDVTWDAVPLDADMSPEAWAPMDTGPVISGTFEPGNWRVTAYAPGEVTLSADVAIFPGQVNDFTVRINTSAEEDHGALGLEGSWQVLAVAPRDAPAGAPTDPMVMVDVTVTSQDTRYGGSFTPTALMTGAPGSEAALDNVTEEEGYLFVTFSLPSVAPEPFVLALAPFSDGFSGTMASGANSVPVIFWPLSLPLPSVAMMQDQLYGPVPEDHGALEQDDTIVFACAEMVCSWTDPASGVTVPLPEGWGVTAPEFQSASATPTQTDMPSMSLFSPDGEELRLNPRMWIDSDGACYDTSDLGSLCHFNDADITTKLTASMIAPLIERGQPVTGAQTRPVSVSIAGADRSEMRQVGIILIEGEDAAYRDGQVHMSEMSAQDHPLGVGNTYDIRAETLFREYRNRNVTIMPGNTVQQVVLAPVYGFDEVSMDLPDDPIIAGSGGYFPVMLTAPEGFRGTISVHDTFDRDGPAIFSIDGARMMDGQDQVLPVPDQPGFYEVRFLDLNGEMFGATEFEAVAPDAGATEITVTPTGRTQFETGCFISAALTGPEGGDYRMIAPVTATANGQDLRNVTDSETPLEFEIISFGKTGQSTADLMLMARCDSITLDFATPQCRYFEGDGIVTRDCPAPVVFAPMQLADGGGFMADAIVQGATEAAQSETATPTDPSFIEITPENGMSTDQLLDLLMGPSNTE
ncbi:MAG: VWA domain-containing protein [Loktanella sp.]|nr:VWA domain-containing protein [Loktanella sp.]